MTQSTAATSTPAIAGHPTRSVLLLGALGVVFGDTGTSPIYAFRESLKAAGRTGAEPTVLGVLSLVFWAKKRSRSSRSAGSANAINPGAGACHGPQGL